MDVTDAASTRSNLGITATMIWSGTQNAGGADIAIAGAWNGVYKAFIFYTVPTGNTYWLPVIVPYGIGDFRVRGAGDGYITLTLSGSTAGALVVKCGGQGSLRRVYGIN